VAVGNRSFAEVLVGQGHRKVGRTALREGHTKPKEPVPQVQLDNDQGVCIHA
jgi:hypothetical protein